MSRVTSFLSLLVLSCLCAAAGAQTVGSSEGPVYDDLRDYLMMETENLGSQMGVCCLPDLGDGVCLEGLPDSGGLGIAAAVICEVIGGMFTPGSTCADVCPADQNACCFPNGACLVLSTTDCASAGASPQGAMTCDLVKCPQPVMGICCNPAAATLVCSQVTACQCAIQGGTFLEGLTCDPINPCVRGACCNECGTCERVRPDECEASGGFFLGQGTDCEESTCLLKAACCMPGNSCLDTSEDACFANGGQWQGLGSMCSDIDCAGACCFPSTGNCDLRLQSRCRAAGGVWQGAGTSCVDGCDQTELNDAPDPEGTTVLDVLGAWGDCPAPCRGDANGDGRVDANDLMRALSATR